MEQGIEQGASEQGIEQGALERRERGRAGGRRGNVLRAEGREAGGCRGSIWKKGKGVSKVKRDRKGRGVTVFLYSYTARR